MYHMLRHPMASLKEKMMSLPSSIIPCRRVPVNTYFSTSSNGSISDFKLQNHHRNNRDTLFNQSTSMVDYFNKSVQKYGSNKKIGYRKVISAKSITLDGMSVMQKKLHNRYTYLTMREFGEQTNTLSKGLQSLGVGIGSRVAIYMETRYEWQMAFFAIIQLGAVPVPLYSTLGIGSLTHCMNQSKATVVLTTDDRVPMLRKICFPDLKHIIYIPFTTESEDGSKTVNMPFNSDRDLKWSSQTWDEVMEAGKKASSFQPASVGPDHLGLISYTSGSSGTPKGVLFNHHHMIQSGRYLTEVDGPDLDAIDNFLVYLPLAHVMEFVYSTIVLNYRGNIHFGSPLTLLPNSPGLHPDSLPDTVMAKPDILLMVPLLLDRIKKRMATIVEPMGLNLDEIVEADDLSQYPLDHIQFMLNGAFGGNLKFIFSGSAALSRKTELFFNRVAQIPIISGYGATETLIAGTMCPINTVDGKGSVGIPHCDVHIKLRDWEEGGYYHKNGQGEILIHAPSLGLGYYQLPEETEESFITHEGNRYWCSGDIGQVSKEETLYIIDRKKELLKLSNGEYVSLSRIESDLRTSSIVDNICVASDSSNNHLIALVVPNKETLEQVRNNYQEREGKGYSMSDEQLVLNALKKTSQTVGLKAREIPTHVILCYEPWNPESRLVTASMKIRRKQITEFYQRKINSINL